MTRGNYARGVRRTAALAGLSAAALLLSAGAASAHPGEGTHTPATLPEQVIGAVCENAANLPALPPLPDVAPAPLTGCDPVNGWQ